MPRLIDVDAVIEVPMYDEEHEDFYTEKMTVEDYICMYSEMPSIIDTVPLKRGKWRFVNCATGLRCQCSECLHWVDAGTDRNHCPNCGSRMDSE